MPPGATSEQLIDNSDIGQIIDIQNIAGAFANRQQNKVR
jgi:hypothetical protein